MPGRVVLAVGFVVLAAVLAVGMAGKAVLAAEAEVAY